MENTESIILPDFSPPKQKRAKKESKKILVEKEVLPRTNRTVVCNYCDSDKILNPDQYQGLFEEYGSEEKLNEEFICKVCEMAAQRNPFEFWTLHGKQFQILIKYIKEAFDVYRASGRNQQDAVTMQTHVVDALKAAHIREPNFEFIIENFVPTAMRIKNIPFVGSVLLQVYENKKARIHIER